ncbi:solute carrier family 13 member 2-like [Chelmon rostratus]|uniref:solute carrier family 13 member 2-like n=1 Tax=Chelmon rostratus TaxID=109905 RepID=UPI001BE8F641|nr:solute carrier family 13 member 2-like [Chelmon rostratus]
MAGFLTWLWRYRNYIVIVLTPLLLLPLPLIIPTPEAKCGFVIILMALYWCTECIPLAVTALLPVILFPMMGIMESGEVCIQYLKDSNMLFFGGLLVAIAVEQWNLHRRIALQVLLVVGVKPSFLMMGFMSTTAFLSMWISNTAATAMMLPIANAVLQQLCETEANAEERDYNLTTAKDGQENQAFETGDTKESLDVELKPKDSSINMDAEKDGHPDTKEMKENDASSSVSSVFPEVCGTSPEVEQRRLKRDQKYAELMKGMSLSVCYAASIGGTATLTGTTPNVILKGQIDELFPGNGGIINFASFFGFSFPNMVLMLALSWLWLQFIYLGFNLRKSFGCGTKKDGDREAFQVIKNEYKRLGRWSFAEACVLVIFTLLVLLWFTREPGFIPGWATVLFNKDKPYVTDGTVAILMSALLFCIPSNLPRCFEKSKDGAPAEAPSPLLSWNIVHEKMPWNILLLLGGGFALAHGSEKSGLSVWLGESLIPLQNIPPFAISILLCLLVAMFTECSSNTETTTLFLPILASMATAIKIHPLYVMLPCTISASLAFMLPVATPPNALAFSYGNLKVMDMAKAGFVLNFVGVVTINIAINTWGVVMFQLNTFPSWANVTTTP